MSDDSLDPLPEIDSEGGTDVLQKSTELRMISDFYMNLNAKIFEKMNCSLNKRLLSCTDLLDLMADLLIEYELRVNELKGGRLKYMDLLNRRFPKTQLKQLNQIFTTKKFKLAYPKLYHKELKSDDINLLIESGLIAQMKAIAQSRSGKTPMELLKEEEFNYHKKEPGISKFAFKIRDDNYKSPPVERPYSPKVSGSKSKSKSKSKAKSKV